jgi:hypothetical protein
MIEEGLDFQGHITERGQPLAHDWISKDILLREANLWLTIEK